MINIEISPDPSRLVSLCDVQTALPFSIAAAVGTAQARANTPIGATGRLRDSWVFRGGTFDGVEYRSAIANTSQTAVYGIMGRGPGKFPPFGANTPLAAWAAQRGIAPFLVARSIAERGTQRWRDRSNWVGYSTRTLAETTDEFEITVRRLAPGSALRNAYDLVVAKFREAQYP